MLEKTGGVRENAEETDPELKGGRSSRLQTGVFFAGTTKKETGFVRLVSPTTRMAKRRLLYLPATGQERAVLKNHVWHQRQKNQHRRARIFFLDFVLIQSTRTQPEATDGHRQTPLRAHPNTPSKFLLAAGGSIVHPPFSSGSVRS